MRWLLTGAQGLLGTDAHKVLEERGMAVTAPGRAALDITDEQSVEDAVRGHDVVLNCAAWTAVDDAETHPDEAFAANVTGPRLLARAARRNDALLVQVSTDYVFDGKATKPYPEGAPTGPRSEYGRTKAAGEQAVRDELPDRHLVVRSGWMYGAHGRCFPRVIARLAGERDFVDVVDDQVGSPTWTRDVAELVLRLVEANAPTGTYHATASGETNWFGFAKEIVVAAGIERSVVRAVSSSALLWPAPRPSYSVLGHDALQGLGITSIGDWRERWQVAAPEVLRDV